MSAFAHDGQALDLAPLDRVIDGLKDNKGALIAILQQAQEIYGYLPRAVMMHIAQRTNTPMHQIFGVATFYSQFYLTRRGKYVIHQCDGTACHVRGAARLIEAVEGTLGMHPGETSDDYRYTYEVVYCLGSCGLAPVAVVNGKVMGRLQPQEMVQALKKLD